MNAYQRGTAINLTVDAFVVIDPITRIAVPTDPTTVTFTILAPDGTEATFTQADANVSNPSYGVYVCALDPQLPVGIYHYLVVGTGAVEAQSEDVFEIIESGVETPAPPPMPIMGPCSPWISGQDVANCARVDYSQDAYVFDTVAYNAGLALYEISGRQFPGICERKVRPCRNACSCWLGGPISYGMGPWFWTSVPWGFGGGAAWYNEQGDKFGCAPMSKWRLAGYPISSIVEVKIDGVVLPEFDATSGDRNWRLDKWRELVRMDQPGTPEQPRLWPGCQNMSLDDDQPGTFSVKYKWGTEVPQLGRDAAVEVANQLYLACGGRECVLPAGVTKVIRQGIEIERGLLANWMDTSKQTGLVQTDLFLAAYCQGQRRGRRSAIWTPDVQAFGRRVGVNE
jgi:hypothetical protein